MQRFDTPAPVSAVLDVPAGRVQFIAADRTDTAVDVRPANPGKSRDIKAAEETEVDFSDGVLRITAAPAKNQFFGPSGSVEITVQLPAGSSVQAKAAGTEFRGVGRLGDVTIDSAQGPIKLDETAGARLTLQGGDIQVGRLTGDAEISTQKGDLTVTEAVRGTLTLRTQAGDINVTAARGTSATLDAGTGYGRVSNALNNSEGAKAALAVNATTSYGDITARSL
ncbi:DUF4097 family beta strand repeat-containing protein [Streptomyces sp. S.PB5]|uniref:DUF4097 family beta strand repeat-containing protein n=1 Tax=Streptomyces sp. S.PB5 TaxID=3020844 RepID=UPI0025B121E5|nr:DUF4097 family beta strand repeat-containing protein [Streptomyces sp. S.PB5]MDN3028501.1 DUF4097 family beta strand repeat-containing protein [Streptomyces sp. S.PB5]